jgi:hypothetical protein
MSPTRRFWLAAAVLTPAACGTLAAQERPAIIASPTEQSRAELLRVVSAATNGQPVTLAEDALTRDSVLTLERRTPPGAEGRAATGRTLEVPAQLKLVLRGERCLLVRIPDGREWQLTEARCVPADSATR